MNPNDSSRNDEAVDESLWDSPAKPAAEPSKASGKHPNPSRPTYQEQEAREDTLRQELQSVRQVNEAIEGVIQSLEKAKDNMKTANNTVTAASTLLNTWTRILSQTEHNQRLILDPNWHGASQDIADIEQEVLEKQRAANRREAEEQERKTAAMRRAEEEEKRKAEAGAKQSKITSRGRLGTTGRNTPSSYAQMGGSSATSGTGTKRGPGFTRRTTSGIGRGMADRASRTRG
ncbi:uncharacterized protein Z518_06534 [Rhinocladiella mackenziei CBS 650.93]|uniref:DASH complex subunit DUO1 n=1 Tax=Rhinocladiella mackenziei CBS 650.93 TaxID=1442369 RepID=A0A0D2IAY8_9EURO|nr:uncharacterized protein Z518_06534 [Rhinocladiella mackenziei CBS 650.93]KIX02984.1 hypothetical protein Z518_06534 [Rhinocladiella mackenziei CBS 650.93]